MYSGKRPSPRKVRRTNKNIERLLLHGLSKEKNEEFVPYDFVGMSQFDKDVVRKTYNHKKLYDIINKLRYTGLTADEMKKYHDHPIGGTKGSEEVRELHLQGDFLFTYSISHKEHLVTGICLGDHSKTFDKPKKTIRSSLELLD